MSNVRSLTCPSCGASLNIEGNNPEIKCAYCGNTVIVPPELRTQSPEQPPVVVFQIPNQVNYQQINDAQQSGRRLMGCIIALIVLSVVGSLVIAVIAIFVPLFAVSSVMSGVNNLTTSIPFSANSPTRAPGVAPKTER